MTEPPPLKSELIACLACGVKVRLWDGEPLPDGWRPVEIRAERRRAQGGRHMVLQDTEYYCPKCRPHD